MTLYDFITSLKSKNAYNFKDVRFEKMEGKNIYFYDSDNFYHKMIFTNIYKNPKPSIKSAINKTDYIINRFIKIHKGKYSYDKFEYKRSDIKSNVLCKIHGYYLVSPNNHYNGKGCPKCAGKGLIKTVKIPQKSLLEKFLENARIIHGNKYNYDNFSVKNAKEKGKIVCGVHGDFYMNINNHISGKQGCRKCKGNKSHYFTIENAEKYKHEWSQIKSSLYLLRLSDNNNNQWLKVGITKRNINDRIYEIPLNCETLNEYKIDLYNAVVIEQTVMKHFRKRKKIPKVNFGGKYECFTMRIKNEMIEFIENHLTKIQLSNKTD